MVSTWSREGFDGHEHARQAAIVLTLVLILAGAALIVSLGEGIVWGIDLAAGLVAGALLGYWITPDIDHEWKTMEESRIERAFGPFLANMWMLLWAPYRKAFGHRSRWTHSWRGTLIRSMPITLALMGTYMLCLNGLGITIRWATPWPVAANLAWLAQDMVHYHHDGLGWLGVGG